MSINSVNSVNSTSAHVSFKKSEKSEDCKNAAYVESKPQSKAPLYTLGAVAVVATLGIVFRKNIASLFKKKPVCLDEVVTVNKPKGNKAGQLLTPEIIEKAGVFKKTEAPTKDILEKHGIKSTDNIAGFYQKNEFAPVHVLYKDGSFRRMNPDRYYRSEPLALDTLKMTTVYEGDKRITKYYAIDLSDIKPEDIKEVAKNPKYKQVSKKEFETEYKKLLKERKEFDAKLAASSAKPGQSSTEGKFDI